MAEKKPAGCRRQPGHFTPRPKAATKEAIVLLLRIVLLIDGTEQEQEHDYEHELTTAVAAAIEIVAKMNDPNRYQHSAAAPQPKDQSCRPHAKGAKVAKVQIEISFAVFATFA